MTDLLQFTLPLHAGVAVLVPDGEDAAPLDGARVLAIPRSEAEDLDALVARLGELRAADGFEFVMLPPEQGDLEPALSQAFERVGADERGVLLSLHERPRAPGPDGLPLPPAHLIRVTSGCARQARNAPARMYERFIETGSQCAGWIRDMLGRAGAEMERMSTVLDFGCGCGRVMRHWRDLADPLLHGSDYNPYLVAWCAKHLAFAEFATNRLEPPLPYGDDTFDLVYSVSIFTHLDEGLQRPWIEELGRVVRPGGLVLVTVTGPQLAHELLPPGDVARFERGELVVKRSELSGMNACAAYHPARYISEELARGFELVEHAIDGAPDVRQDAVLLRVPA